MQIGALLGHYRVLSLLGTGGMGVVYLAADERLKRNVALKILPDALVHDASRLRRFMQEAQTASALNHPSIVTIYEIGMAREADCDRHYIAMELIEGKTLRELPPSRTNLKRLLAPFVDVAEGLARAHAAGIIHRDLKPENIMITVDGRAKIVDFGLAKLTPCGDDLRPDTATAVLETGAGVMMGTVGYMSPEQVEARTVDHRSDIFSLGCVLYESVAGTRAFSGRTAVDTLHQIVHGDPPPLHDLNPAAPSDLVRVIKRCLAKDPDERFQSVKEVAIELRALLRRETYDSATLQAAPAKSGEQRRWKSAALAAAITVAIAVTSIFVIMKRPPPGLSSYHFTPIETAPEYEGFPAWSPDGKTIAYVAEAEGVLQVFTRSLGSSRRARITSQPRDCREPFWSPDGTRIYFISTAGNADGLWVVGAAGGAPQVVLPNVYTAAISPDGNTLAALRERSDRGPMMSLEFASATGTKVRPYEHPGFEKRNLAAGALRFSPDGTKLGAWLHVRGIGTPREFWEISIPDMKPRRRLEVLSALPRTYPFDWLPDGRHLMFGGEVPGSLSGSHLWLADTATNRLQPITATAAHESHPGVSPDGKRIVFSTEDQDFDLLSISLSPVAVTPLLATARAERMPAWAPDGGSYAFVTDRSGSEEVWLRSANGDFERPLVSKTDFNDGVTGLIASIAFSPDGQRIAYQRGGGNYRVWISSVAGGAPVPLNRQGSLFEDHPTWSPGGEWMAFTGYRAERAAVTLDSTLMKVRVGIDAPPIVLLESIVPSGDVKWSPTGEWIACETVEGITLVSPDGATKRILVVDSWLAFDWSQDGKTIYAIRTDGVLHVVVVKVDVATGREDVVTDLGLSPPTNYPYQGLSVAPGGKTIATSVIRLRGDLWLLEGWPEPRGRFGWLTAGRR